MLTDLKEYKEILQTKMKNFVRPL